MDITVRREGSFCNFTREEDGVKTVHHCRDIRGGLTWPTLTAPGYFCILAQLTDLNVQGKLPLVLLGEGENQLPHKFFSDLLFKAKEYRCRTFYADLARQTRELAQLFSSIVTYGRISYVELKRAPFANDFSVGLGLAREWSQDQALKIPEGSTMRSQLGAISSGHLTEQALEQKFYALPALFYVVASVEKTPWQQEEFVAKKGPSRSWYWG
jgi:hypothetical protein